MSYGYFFQQWTSWSYCHMRLCKKAFVWERGLFTCWLAPCHSTQLWISLHWRLAELIWSWELMLCPSLIVDCQQPFIYNITQIQNVSLHISPCYPLTAVFFFNFLSPHSTKCGLERLTEKVWVGLLPHLFLAFINVGRGDRERVIKTWGAEGSHRHTQYKGSKHKPQLSQHVVSLIDWFWQPCASADHFKHSFIKLLNPKRRTLTFKRTFSRLVHQSIRGILLRLPCCMDSNKSWNKITSENCITRNHVSIDCL